MVDEIAEPKDPFTAEPGSTMSYLLVVTDDDCFMNSLSDDDYIHCNSSCNKTVND